MKTPKLYWRDSGVLHALLGTATQDELLNQPWVGASWEGYVIEQILGIPPLWTHHFAPPFRAPPFRARSEQHRRIDNRIRINDQWRIVFRWSDGNVHAVRILDYHS
ncbi:MAG: DUF4143 domain-containing protein [Phycisphaerae bacterium]|nr:DUF4143 domain-containing protein [Phycisphaerae bacterium]